MVRLSLLSVFICQAYFLLAQISAVQIPQLDSLKQLYGKNKLLPADFEIAALMALSFYPELINTPVEFVVKPSKYPYASRPKAVSLLPFVPKKYLITISNRSSALREPTLLNNLTFNEQVGALGHELAHTAYYEQTRKGKIIINGIRYRSDRYKERFEKMTDRIAIKHGLGSYLLAWNEAVYPVKIRDGKRGKIYYSPAELKAMIENPH